MKFFRRKKRATSDKQNSASKSSVQTNQAQLTPLDELIVPSKASPEYTFQYTSHDKLYGQDVPVETPELISSKLQELEDEINKIPKENKQEWLSALRRCPDLCNTDKFKLMFLRCEVFNTKLAAERIMNYWKHRTFLFGKELAYQSLTLGPNGPFQNDDKALKEIAWIRTLNQRDLAGRPIIFGDPSRLPVDHSSYDNAGVVRAMWYYIHSFLGDETAHRKGVVMLIYPKHISMGTMNRSLAKMHAESIKGCIPIRISAIHICHPPKVLDLVFPIVKVLMGPRLRKKIRLNSGSDESVLKKFDTKFGISSNKVPTELGGSLVLDHEQWLEDRMKRGL